MGLENPPENAHGDDKRKSSKPLMEKRRRARINQSLNELKNLILEAMKKDVSCYSKLEKADILEMTVRYLRSMKNQNASACMNAADSNAMARYRAGYNECANEVSRYLISLDGLNVQVRARLLSHLASHCSPIIKPASSTSQETPQINQPQSFTAVPMTSPLEAPGLGLPTFGIAKQLDAGTNLLNSAQFQIVPGQLANGKIAAVLLPSQNAPVAMVSAPQLIPVFNKPGGDLQFHVQSSHALRPDNDPLWRPW